MTVNTFYQCLPIKHSVNMSYYTHFARNKLIKLSATLGFLDPIFYFYNHQAKSYYHLKHSIFLIDLLSVTTSFKQWSNQLYDIPALYRINNHIAE